MIRPLHLASLALLAFVVPTATRAADADPKGIEFFESKIRPVLVAQCYECHSTKSAKVKGELLLDSRDGIRKGGVKGPAVVPGSVADSLLIKAIKHDTLKMPPAPAKQLADTVVNDFVAWVKMGAPDPRDAAATTAYKRMTPEEARTHWAFLPPQKTTAPTVKNASWAKSDIDRFLLAKLEAAGLKPNGDADKLLLLRRLYLDLVGMPPSPEEMDAFLKDSSPQAVEKVVDKLLASPQFGERWGRHWLDIARYAESNGNADNTPFPQAWRFRDYVIASFNADKPYDQFIREQIAGDLLPSKDAKQKDEYLIATGLLALTSKPRAQNNPDYRMDLIADQVDVTTRAVLGLTVMCARCHDHKFDQIATREYYSLAGFFDSTQMLAGAGGRGGNVKGMPAGALHKLSDDSEAMGVRDAKSTDTAVCIRGDSTKRGETPQRGFLAVATYADAPTVNRSQSGRLELAQWLTSPKNPLPARVAVNRVWLHLFGRGLVNTPDNFGYLGEKPSHPELLDYLSVQFVEQGWSMKKLIRSVVLSRVYQLDSDHDDVSYKKDPDNLLLWRMNPRRLEGEVIRDSVLAASGQIDLEPPQASLATVRGGNARRPQFASQDSRKRSVYLGIVRGAPLPEILAVFDVANPNLVVAQREITTVPTQALFMMNSPFVVEQSKQLATRLLQYSDLDDAGRVDMAYHLALSRPATQAERDRAAAFVQETAKALGGDKKNGDQQTRAWASFCQALFASAEFRYVR